MIIIKVDILAFGAHPDDVEVGAGGLMAVLAQRGLKVAVVDLTGGEMASNGSPEERNREAQRASEHLAYPAKMPGYSRWEYPY
ncbi:hypothetical protein N752_27460 [Desulforamulus aquiferis]|nr:hypothetical protein N752_27460 [Desulforamulus aquiferis]